MKRSEIREGLATRTAAPDFAPLHPGYRLRTQPLVAKRCRRPSHPPVNTTPSPDHIDTMRKLLVFGIVIMPNPSRIVAIRHAALRPAIDARPGLM
jgi:hypothetical protein